MRRGILLGLVVFGVWAPGASALTIDDFSEGSGSISLMGAGTPTATDTDTGLSAASTLGGIREVSLTKNNAEAGEGVNATWNPPTSMISAGSTALGNGRLDIYYDGDATAGLNPDGLSADLDAAGTGVRVAFSTNFGPASLTITLYSGSGNASQALVMLGGAQSPVFVPFSSFTTTGGTGADFGDVGAIVLQTYIASGATTTLDDLSVPTDADHDGISPPVDCDDTKASVHPGATEIPGNSVDENCDGIAAQLPAVAAPPAAATSSPTPGPKSKRCKKKRKAASARKKCRKKKR